MPSVRAAALALVFMLILVSGFQLALALGAPLGSFAMGGAFQGTYPPAMRIAAILQVVLYAGIGIIVLSCAEVAFPKLRGLAGRLIWPIVLLFVAATVLNFISPSARERLLWTPVAIAILLLSLRVALRTRSQRTGPG